MMLRAPLREDAAAVAALLAPRNEDAFGWSAGALEDLLGEWGSCGFDLAHDAVVAEQPGRGLTGYAVAHRFGTFGVVDPRCEGQGIGSALLDWCEQRQREGSWKVHRSSIPAKNLRAQALLAGRGYRLARSHWRMTIGLGETPHAGHGPHPRGATLRALDVRADGAAIHRLDQEAFATVAGTEPESYEEFAEEHLQGRDLDVSLSRVAERDGEILGFALTRRREAESAAYVDILAVDPPEQGRGVGRTLLLEVFAAARRAGLAEAQLGVAGDNPKALRLYEGVGMSARAQLDVYERRAGVRSDRVLRDRRADPVPWTVMTGDVYSSCTRGTERQSALHGAGIENRRRSRGRWGQR